MLNEHQNTCRMLFPIKSYGETITISISNQYRRRETVQNNGNSEQFHYDLISTFRLIYSHHQDNYECYGKITKTYTLQSRCYMSVNTTQLNMMISSLEALVPWLSMGFCL